MSPPESPYTLSSPWKFRVFRRSPGTTGASNSTKLCDRYGIINAECALFHTLCPFSSVSHALLLWSSHHLQQKAHYDLGCEKRSTAPGIEWGIDCFATCILYPLSEPDLYCRSFITMSKLDFMRPSSPLFCLWVYLKCWNRLWASSRLCSSL